MRNAAKKFARALKSRRRTWHAICSVARVCEGILYGGSVREAALLSLLGALYRSQFRREWVFTSQLPHFYNHRWNAFSFAYGQSRSPYAFYRGFLASEVLHHGDRLLDIGCGDGFFSSTFFSARCCRIDAIDTEPSAIGTAKRLNPNSKVHFSVLNAVRDPFPSTKYDVVVWDGAIGHFSPSDVPLLLKKIRDALSLSGVLVGSESLGREGHDHLHFFRDESVLASVFRPFFKHVWVRSIEYRLENGFLRTEAFWRCANDPARQQATLWSDFSRRPTGESLHKGRGTTRKRPNNVLKRTRRAGA